jgi:hypothetical protein
MIAQYAEEKRLLHPKRPRPARCPVLGVRLETGVVARRLSRTRVMPVIIGNVSITMSQVKLFMRWWDTVITVNTSGSKI